MRTCKVSLATMIALVVTVSSPGAAPLNKCLVNGTVTYQQGLCPSGQVRRPPTVQELNEAQKARREAATSAPATGRVVERTSSNPGFTCDGRTYCSQMSSCAEAKYFLAHCPGVKMDGDRNGVPCEKQWCTR